MRMIEMPVVGEVCCDRRVMILGGTALVAALGHIAAIVLADAMLIGGVGLLAALLLVVIALDRGKWTADRAARSAAAPVEK